MKNFLYLFNFNMLSPMHSRRHIKNSFLVDNAMIKIGITDNLERRKKEYESTYYCSKCHKSHCNLLKAWEVKLSISELKNLEKEIKDEFNPIQGEYYSITQKQKIITWINLKFKEKSFIKVNINQSSIKRNKKMNELNFPDKEELKNYRFIRTDKTPGNRAADHNLRRWNWIAKAGSKGKTFSEIDKKNSYYRLHGIVRPDYGGNTSSIYQDLKHDFKGGFVKFEKI